MCRTIPCIALLAICAAMATKGVLRAHEEVADDPAAQATEQVVAQLTKENEPKPAAQVALPDFLQKSVSWLIASQHNDGGWGGGSHARQKIRDPHAVTTDPATTSFTLLALMRSGHTPVAGDYQAQVKKGLEYLVTAVEKAEVEGPLITDVTGTQPQTKLGRFVDTSMTAQYLARVLTLLPKESPLQLRVDAALDKCLAKLQVSQHADGSWGKGGGWAPVLQSSLSCSALEIAAANGKQVDKKILEKAREYQRTNYDTKSGKANAEAAAGVELYAFGSALRGNASQAREADEIVEKAKQAGQLKADAPVNEESLRIAGVKDAEVARKLANASVQNQAQLRRLGDEKLLRGFGNNGGEEYLTYLMTSESLVIAGPNEFKKWNEKMLARLKKSQNTDGSWSGHHCITSPVFCTSAVVQCLTTENDAEFLTEMARRTTDEKLATVDR
jgi:hypothetical protein